MNRGYDAFAVHFCAHFSVTWFYGDSDRDPVAAQAE